MHLRPVIRSLTRTPGFTAAVITTIALGVGATTAMFSVVYAVLFRPLPYPDAGRLAVIWQTQPLEDVLKRVPDAATAYRLATRSMLNSQALPEYRSGNHSFDDIAGYAPMEVTLTGTSEPERVEAIAATSRFFTLLGTRPLSGRLFLDEDDEPGKGEVVVLGYSLWKRRFSGDPDVVGRVIGVDGLPHTIVGVLPADFHVVLPYATREPAMVTPIAHRFGQGRKWAIVTAFGRLKGGVTPAAAAKDMSALTARMGESSPLYRNRGANIVPLADEMADNSRLSLMILLGAAGCVLLIGCANVANLLLVRAGVRQKELATRTALGASRGHLVRQALTESMLLAVVGGIAGLVIAYWGTRVLVALMPERLFPRMEDIAVDRVVLAFGLLVSGVVGVAAGLLPAGQTLRWDRRGALNLALGGSQRGASAGRGHRLVSRVLVGAQVAVAMVILLAAILLTQTYVRTMGTDLGIRPERVLTFSLVLPTAQYATPPSRTTFVEVLLPRLAVLPGAEAAGLSNSLPVASTFTASIGVQIEGRPLPGDPLNAPALHMRTIAGDVFRAAGIRLAYGRLLTETDGPDVLVLNRSAVRRYWPDAGDHGPEPLGRRLLFGKRTCTIVGVVDDVKYSGPTGAVFDEAYVPFAFWPTEYLSLMVRTTGSPAALVAGARAAVRSVDPDLPLLDVRTMEEVLSETVAPPRFRFVLIGAFAGLALVLALIGLYGVIAQSVTQRRQEIGIRMALGAGRWQIARMVLVEAVVLAAVGVIVGAALSLASTRVLATFLYGVTGTEPGNYIALAFVITLLALVASYGPARRAMRSDPALVLRAE